MRLKRLLGRLVGERKGINIDELSPSEKKKLYEEIRRRYLEQGITLEDLFNYFEFLWLPREKKEKIKRLIRKYGIERVMDDYWYWWNLAEEYNPEELSFLYENH